MCFETVSIPIKSSSLLSYSHHVIYLSLLIKFNITIIYLTSNQIQHHYREKLKDIKSCNRDHFWYLLLNPKIRKHNLTYYKEKNKTWNKNNHENIKYLLLNILWMILYPSYLSLWTMISCVGLNSFCLKLVHRNLRNHKFNCSFATRNLRNQESFCSFASIQHHRMLFTSNIILNILNQIFTTRCLQYMCYTFALFFSFGRLGFLWVFNKTWLIV